MKFVPTASLLLAISAMDAPAAWADCEQLLAGDELIQFLKTPIKDVPFHLTSPANHRIHNELLSLEIIFLGDLVRHSTDQISAKISNFSYGTTLVVQRALAKMGLRLGMKVPGWPQTDLDVIEINFAKQEIPHIPLDQWFKRDHAKNENLMHPGYRGLSAARPIALVLTEDQPTFAFIQYQYFNAASRTNIQTAIESSASIPPGLFEQLKLWKSQLSEFERAPLSSLSGGEGCETFTRILIEGPIVFLPSNGGAEFPPFSAVVVIPLVHAERPVRKQVPFRFQPCGGLDRRARTARRP